MGVFTESARFHFVRLYQLLNFPCMLSDLCTLSLALLIFDDLYYITKCVSRVYSYLIFHHSVVALIDSVSYNVMVYMYT